jgi:hypothetical protein
MVFPFWASAWFSGSQVVSYISSVTAAVQAMVPWF